jgi:hypothetical protein
MEYIFDGEIHPIDNKWSYILSKTNYEYSILHEDTLTDLNEKFLQKYKEYLSLYDKDKLEKLRDSFTDLGGVTPDDYEFVYRPPMAWDPISLFGTFALKFRRAEKDNL